MLKQHGIDADGAKVIIGKGREAVKKSFYEDMRRAWEKKGLIEPQVKESLLGNICCIVFMLLFFLLMVYSKLNQEAAHLLGFDGSQNFTVAAC